MQFVDIHSHILFEVDDGADNVDVSLRMIKQAVDLGIKHIQATPHATEMMNDAIAGQFTERFKELKNILKEENLPIRISMAAEVFFSELIFSWIEKPWATFGGENRYILFELPMFEIPDKVDDFIFQCRMKNIIPILAHPERYIRLQDNPGLLLKWHRQGCFMQLNAGSLAGQFGERIKEFSTRLIRAGIFQFIASDAHEDETRNFEILVKATEEIVNLISPEYAEELCYLNPGKAIRGEKIRTREVLAIPDKDRWYKHVLKNTFQQVFKI